jgi:hypothetical protein
MQNVAENVAVIRDEKQEAEQTALEALVRLVAEDARKRPEAYLNETIVPEGGE